MHFLPLAADVFSGWQLFVQQCINGLTFGALVALVALGYTMVYGIIGLINFAHGDLFMLGSMFALTLDRMVRVGVGDVGVVGGARAIGDFALGGGVLCGVELVGRSSRV